MKSLTRILIGFIFLTATTAFAADNKGSLQISAPVTVGGAQLPTGDYIVQWDGQGPDVELRVKQGNKVKATISATLVPLEHPYDQNAAVVRINDDGSRNLVGIHLSGKKFALGIQSPASEMSSSRK